MGGRGWKGRREGGGGRSCRKRRRDEGMEKTGLRRRKESVVGGGEGQRQPRRAMSDLRSLILNYPDTCAEEMTVRVIGDVLSCRDPRHCVHVRAVLLPPSLSLSLFPFLSASFLPPLFIFPSFDYLPKFLSLPLFLSLSFFFLPLLTFVFRENREVVAKKRGREKI